jgi:Na+-transporting methylmalonyl-CoA/oxaloacetate decarboxylase gamma subunit
MLSTVEILYVVGLLVVFAILITLVLIGMSRARKRAQANPIKTGTAPIPDASRRNPDTHIDNDNVRIN